MNLRHIKKFLFAVTVTGNFIAILDSTSVNISLYQIGKDLNLPMSDVQWVYTVYILTLSSLLPVFGKLGDLFKRNVIYSLGFIFFSVGAFLCSTAGSFRALLLFRGIEAVGGAILMSNANAIITSIFHGEDRGEALGMLGAVIAVGGMLGPAVGGVMLHYFGWHSIFIPVTVIGIICAYPAYKMLPAARSASEVRLDIPGFIMLAAFLFTLLAVLSEGNDWGWTSPYTIGLGIISALLGIVFYLFERRTESPAVDFNIFKNKTVFRGNIALCLCFMAMNANTMLFPFFTQTALKYSAIKTALVMLTYPVGNIFFAPLAGKFSARAGSAGLTLAGGLIIAAGLSFFVFAGPETSVLYLIAGEFITGSGSAIFQSPANNAIMSSAPRRMLGVNSGLMSLSRNVGMVLGIVISSTVFALSQRAVKCADPASAFSKAYHVPLAFGVGTALVCAAVAYSGFRKKT